SKERAMHRLTLVVPVALLITMALLFNAFGALAPAVLVLLTVPFALVGGVAGLVWAGLPLSVSAAVGFIALIGQASLNGVLVLPVMYRLWARAVERWPVRNLVPARAVRAVSSTRRRDR